MWRKCGCLALRRKKRTLGGILVTLKDVISKVSSIGFPTLLANTKLSSYWGNTPPGVIEIKQNLQPLLLFILLQLRVVTKLKSSDIS